MVHSRRPMAVEAMPSKARMPVTALRNMLPGAMNHAASHHKRQFGYCVADYGFADRLLMERPRDALYPATPVPRVKTISDMMKLQK